MLPAWLIGLKSLTMLQLTCAEFVMTIPNERVTQHIAPDAAAAGCCMKSDGRVRIEMPSRCLTKIMLQFSGARDFGLVIYLFQTNIDRLAALLSQLDGRWLLPRLQGRR